MLTILTTTNQKKDIQNIINSVDRLNELVKVIDNQSDINYNTKILRVQKNTIHIPLDWYDREPPYIFPKASFSSENLLALVFFKLGNQQTAFEYINEESELFQHLLLATYLQFAYAITDQMLDFAKETSLHNFAILQHYGNTAEKIAFAKLQKLYQNAINQAESDEIKAFTTKYYTSLLLDANESNEAKELILSLSNENISPEANNALETQLASILMLQLKVPYQQKELAEIQKLQEKCIVFYEEKGLKVNAGLLLIEASEITNLSNDFIKSKDLISKAIQYFKEEDIPEFLGEATLKKANLLYHWSKNGSPQYYKPAINAFQDTLKVFKKEVAPEKFAEIHHNLALIYAEIPASPEEKAIWSAFSASSFKEALSFYDKNYYPYEFAMVSHNYATAFMNFPTAKLHNNFDKAQQLFEDALEVRTSQKYPYERALTLLNQLELLWLTHNENEAVENEKLDMMTHKAEEIKRLVNDEKLLKKAEEHLEELEKLNHVLVN